MVYGRICSCCGLKYNDDEKSGIRNNTKAKTTVVAAAAITTASGGGDGSLLFCQPCSSSSPPMIDMSVYTIPTSTPVVVLEASKAFCNLTDKEKKYALALSRADWEGAKICLLQCSPESPMIFSLLQFAFGAGGSSKNVKQRIEDAKKKDDALTNEEIEKALIYCAAFYGNMGNYKSFGDTKFTPALPPHRFYRFLSAVAADAVEKEKQKLKGLWDQCVDRMYSLPPRHRQLGLGKTNGISTYFSSNCEERDAQIAAKFLNTIGLSPYNTRLFKSKTQPNSYTILLASSFKDNNDNNHNKKDDDNNNSNNKDDDERIAKLCHSDSIIDDKEHKFQHKDEENNGNIITYKFVIQRGDYAPLMNRIVQHLDDALNYTANDYQTNMIQSYIKSFKYGSIEQHKTASRYWIQDKGPVIESYIGFIESYRDPSGVRGEWEGFVACVNKEVSRKFNTLVNKAKELLLLMPWSKLGCYEKDEFLRPDFTSLEVLSFGSSGVPAGINIPNYDDIRQREGFKNVSLGNVLQASYNADPSKPVTFIDPKDQELFKKCKGDAFEVQVGIHELLGHGSGKLYHADSDDTQKTFFSQQQYHPVTNKPITGPFYAPGATWDSTFGKLASTYEECRAECSGLYLCLESIVLEVFGHYGDAAAATTTTTTNNVHDITYINWLLMVRAGLLGLEFYSPETKEWKQAHMCARYVILRVLLEGSGVILKQQSNNNHSRSELKGEKEEDESSSSPLISITIQPNKNNKDNNNNDNPQKTTIPPQDGGDDKTDDIVIRLNRSKIRTVGKDLIGNFLLSLQIYKSLGDYPNGKKFYEQYSHVPEEMLVLRKIVMERKEPRKLLIQPHLYYFNDNNVNNNHNDNNVVRYKSFEATPTGMIESFVTRYPSEDPELLQLYELDSIHHE